jgi:PAS domain S-box-containing protein
MQYNVRALLCSRVFTVLIYTSLITSSLLHYYSSQSFERSATAVRISDLLRLMLTCVDAMVLTDIEGKIVHCNRQWVELTGYSLSEVEGSTCSLLQGSMTDLIETRRSAALLRMHKSSSMSVVNYRKDGSMFVNQVTTVPIRGGFKSDGKYSTSCFVRALQYCTVLCV